MAIDRDSIIVPSGPASITPAWMTTALRAGGLDVTVSDLSTAVIEQRVGMTGAFIRCRLAYGAHRAGAPDSVIAKMLGAQRESVRHAQEMNLWEREIRFYREIAPRIGAPVPRCYFAASDPENGSHILLLEDLSDCQQPGYASMAQAETVVRWLAGMHAHWRGRVEKAFPWLETEAAFERLLRDRIEKSWPQYLKAAEGYVPARQIAMVGQSIERLGEGLTGTGLTPTLLHYDFRIGNMMFRSDDEVVVLDWQSPLVGQATSDLAWFIGDSIEPAQRGPMRELLIRLYREESIRCGASPDELDVFEAQYQRGVLRRLPMSVLTATTFIALGNEGGRRTWASDYDELEAIWRKVEGVR